MWLIYWVLITVSLLVIRKLIDIVYRTYYNYPNGSVGFPVIGLFLNGLSYPPDYINMAKIYKPFTMYYLGLSKVIHVHDYKIMTGILTKRHFYENRLSMTGIGWGAVDAFPVESGHKWLSRRKIAQSSLLTILNYLYLDEIIVNTFNKSIFPKLDKISLDKTVWHCREDARFIAFSSLYIATFGKEINVDNPDLHKLMICAEKIIGHCGINMLLRILFNGIGDKYILILGKLFVNQKYYAQTNDILTKWIKHEKHSDDENIFLNIMLKHVGNNVLTFEEMLNDLNALFSIASHGTAATLEQIILFSAKYPNVQDQIYEELRDTQFSFKHIGKFTIFRAFIHECLRWSGIVGTSVPRIIKTNNAKIGKYDIPNNAILVCNYKCVNFNRKYWKFPSQFNIYNFIDDNNKFKRSMYLMSFGYGGRDCMGRSLAMRTLYVAFGSLFKHYKFEIPPHVQPDSFKIPKSFHGFNVKNVGIVVKKRQ